MRPPHCPGAAEGGCQATCLSGMKRCSYPHAFAFSPKDGSDCERLQGGLIWREGVRVRIARVARVGALSERERMRCVCMGLVHAIIIAVAT